MISDFAAAILTRTRAPRRRTEEDSDSLRSCTHVCPGPPSRKKTGRRRWLPVEAGQMSAAGLGSASSSVISGAEPTENDRCEHHQADRLVGLDFRYAVCWLVQ